MIGIAGSIMSMYTDSVMVLLVTRQCFAPVKDTHQATAVPKMGDRVVVYVSGNYLENAYRQEVCVRVGVSVMCYSMVVLFQEWSKRVKGSQKMRPKTFMA